MENKIHLSQPPIYNHHSYESNALYYRSNVDDKEYIILIQSRCPNERICKYDIQNDKYIPISPILKHFNSSSTPIFPFKYPKISQIITESCDTNASKNENQLLTICTNKNQLAALNLNSLKYTPNYQSTYNKPNHRINKSLMFIVIPIITILLLIFTCNDILIIRENCNNILMSLIYGLFIYFISIYLSNFTHQFEQDIKCVIPHFDSLYNIQSCYIPNDGIHFIANNYKTKCRLNHFKFCLKSRQFIELSSIIIDEKQNSNGETSTNATNETVRAYKIVYIQFMETLIMFTNSENIYYYDLNDDEEKQWRIYEDVQLPKIPGNNEWEINIIIAFKGIIFLFYYQPNNQSNNDNCDDEYDDEYTTYTYCWDLLFTGNMFECDNKCVCNNSGKHCIARHCIAINTHNNYTHFIGENPSPFHFKISLSDEIPIELTIIHLQYFHSLIKQYIRKNIKHKISNDMEMLILDYFPMFL